MKAGDVKAGAVKVAAGPEWEEPGLHAPVEVTPMQVTPQTDPQLAQLALKDLRRRAEAERRDAAHQEQVRDGQARARAEEDLTALTRAQRELRDSLNAAGLKLPVSAWGAWADGETTRLSGLVGGHWLTLRGHTLRRAGVEGESGLVRGAADLLAPPVDAPVVAWPELELRAAERTHEVFRRAQWVIGTLAAALVLAALVLAFLGLGALFLGSLLISAAVALGLVTAWNEMVDGSLGSVGGLIVASFSLALLALMVGMLSTLWPALLLPVTLPLLLARRWVLGTGPARRALRG